MINTTDLAARCAAHGWALTQDDAGYTLTGNGPIALFRDIDSLVVWLNKQDRPKAQIHPDHLRRTNMDEPWGHDGWPTEIEYPRFEDLGIEPDYLTFGASAMHALGATTPQAPVIRTGRSAHIYTSRYVGVTKSRGYWVGLWGPRGRHQGPRRPPTPDGEKQAAIDRARAIGRTDDDLELR